MKKYLLIIVLIITFAGIAAAQNNQRDVIYLKSGSTVKGHVIDKKTDGSVRVKTGDGHVYHFDGKEVQRIEKETPKANNNQQQQQNDYDQPSGGNRNRQGKHGKHGRGNRYEHNNPAARNQTVTQQNQYQSRQSERRNTYKNKTKDKMPNTYASEGYRYFVEAGFMPGVNCKDSDSEELTSRVSLSTSHGYQFDSYKYFGGGIGAEYLLKRKEVAIMPFAEFRYDFFAELNAPFVGSRLGGYIHKVGSGVFFNAYVGYHFGRVSLTAGYEVAPYSYQTSSSKIIYDETKYYSSFLFRFAMDWGGR
ncbi:MAG: hypothetical protein K6F33_06530 [Bacteroidales bacterium]|nr:hypothetical protein [Bacteroidales bacterium]